MNKLFVESFFLFPPHQRTHELPPWASEVPSIVAAQRRPLTFSSPATFITGENGMGKSTLIEAIAVACGFDIEGGPYGLRSKGTSPFDKGRGESPFHGTASVTRGPRSFEGYYLRAESHINVPENLIDYAPELQAYTTMSHGESVMAMIERYFHKDGLYILDEPESGLSTLRQMALMAELHALVQHGAQIIVATHSPILLSLPGAAIWEIIEAGLTPTALRETTAFRAMRDFFESPHEIAEFMAESMQNESTARG
ncbi:AAA family ATPase [Corynebacterium lowii]|uniref:Vitamin B12 import ATP-binding protein BtuD n=1 Tax=Corynebacterium lowii TaxID=1544413 RepID=A0A0Q0Z9M1_9CORY|nr:AAA family ATPase [Corynebacterium lowii]KQB86341.1 Vitamin B12 import ATP-binding protein BtuD [Corynebacterium lowii]MDP9850826.1 putative ATPase [Corynebacterium lowii]